MADTGLRFGTFALSTCICWLNLKAVMVSVLHQFMQKMRVKQIVTSKSLNNCELHLCCGSFTKFQNFFGRIGKQRQFYSKT